MRLRTAILSVLASCAFAVSLGAQGFVKEGFSTEDFPQVSFVWHEYNPDLLDSQDFQSFRENGVLCDFTVTNLPQNIDPKLGKQVVFLWEDLAYHGANLFNFSRSSLKGFLDQADIKDSDMINVSVYGRRDINDESYLKDLTDGFTSDKELIRSSVESYTRSKKLYASYPNRADIFPAICEAIEKLKDLNEGVKSIVVITAGYPLDNSSSSSDVNARLMAEKYHIPVYFIQYGTDHGYSAKLSDFAPLTYGTFECFKELDKNRNISNAVESISDIYAALPTRYSGRDYEITFTSNTKRGDDAAVIEFKSNGYDHKESFLPPSRSLGGFFKDHPILASICCIFLASLIALAIVMYVRSRRADKERIANISAQAEHNQQVAMGVISDTHKSLNQKINQIQEDLHHDKEADLNQLMRQKNVYPRLICQINGETISCSVTKTHVVVGRDASCDIRLTDSRVSRCHAYIDFNGHAFVVSDAGSTNGVYLNGQRLVSEAVLKDSDKLDIGGVSITVYI